MTGGVGRDKTWEERVEGEKQMISKSFVIVLLLEFTLNSCHNEGLHRLVNPCGGEIRERG